MENWVGRYNEVGENYRFFLKVRHSTFAGYVIVLGAVISVCISGYKDAREIIWIIPLLASPIGLFLWMIDVRTRDLYHAAIGVGKALEVPNPGFYAEVLAKHSHPSGVSPIKLLIQGKPTQSAAIDLLFFGGSGVMLAFAGIIFFYH